jgi:nicotinamidase-related amidase
MEARSYYANHGIGGRVGFGKWPAIIVIDMQYDFLDPASHLDMGPEARAVIPQIARVLEAGRRAGVPIVYTRQTHRPDFQDGHRWMDKFTKFRQGGLREGTRGVEIVDELAPRPEDRVLKKLRPSAFFATELDIYLRSLGVDTTILTGCTTSGCVRATASDAFSYDYRVIVPQECVTDRAKEPHDANLFDINMKLGDVVGIEEVLAHLHSIHAASG